MKVIVNKFLPFHGFIAMMLFGVIFWREEYKDRIGNSSYYKKVVNHESIHEAQMLDFTPSWFPHILRIIFGGLLFYICYLFEWIVRLFVNGPSKAYRSLSFEQEAYIHEYDYEYLKTRKRFSEWRK